MKVEESSKCWAATDATKVTQVPSHTEESHSRGPDKTFLLWLVISLVVHSFRPQGFYSQLKVKACVPPRTRKSIVFQHVTRFFSNLEEASRSKALITRINETMYSRYWRAIQESTTSPTTSSFFTWGFGRGKTRRSAVLHLEAMLHRHGDDGEGVKKVSVTIFLTSKQGCRYMHLKMKLGRASMWKESSYHPATGDSGFKPWQLPSVLLGQITALSAFIK